MLSLDLLPLGLAVLTLWGLRPAPFPAQSEDALSPDRCLALRGVMAVTVVLHHLAQQTEGGRIMRSFLYFGMLPVSVFFFLSGLGVMRGLLRRREDYARGFLRRHLGALALLFFPVLGLFALLYAVLGDPKSLPALLGLVFHADPILVILWYLPVQALFYLVFGLLARLFPDRPGRVLAGMAVFCLGYQLTLALLGVGQWWYNTCQLLPLGMAWALFEPRLRPMLRRAYWPLLLLCAAAFALLYQFFDAVFALAPGPWMRLGLLCSRNVIFTLCVVLALYRLRLGNRASRFLGARSGELYALHPLPLMLFHSWLCPVENELAYALAVLAASILLAALLHPLYTAARKLLR